MWWKERDGSVDTSKGKGVGEDHRDPREFRIQVSIDSLFWSINVAPSGVSIPHVERPRGQIIHGPGVGGIGKNISAKTARSGEHLRVDEGATGPRSQEGRSQDPKTNRNNRQKPSDFAGVQKTPGGFPS